VKDKDFFMGKNVLITGAAGGLGRELCLAFGSRGARIIALDIQPESLQSLKHLLEENNIPCSTFVCDIADKDQCKHTVEEIAGDGVSLDMVIHNAGISHRSTFAKTRLDVLEKIITVNINGTINLTHFTLNHLIRNKGTYVVISSVAGFAPLMGRTGYAASKHALHGFFETLRIEVEDDGVKVLMVCPSFMKTAMVHTAFGGDGKHAAQQKQTAGNVLTPEFVARRVVKGILANKKRIYISSVAKLSSVMSRLVPGLYGRVMKRSVMGEFK
jgi:short-subunit dehydrogenase